MGPGMFMAVNAHVVTGRAVGVVGRSSSADGDPPGLAGQSVGDPILPLTCPFTLAQG